MPCATASMATSSISAPPAAAAAGLPRAGPAKARNVPAIQEPHEPDIDAPGGVAAAPADRDAREATELAQLRRNYTRASSYSRSAPSNASRPSPLGRFTYTVRKFWRHQISITVDHTCCRDHLALERTFLGYLRTSLALSMLGIVVAQLFRLQHAPALSTRFGYFVLDKPLSCICQGAAIYTLLLGAVRTWRSQNAMVRGKAISGGFELVLLAGGVFMILLGFMVLLIVVDITKEDLN